jgi:hypothetical protein
VLRRAHSASRRVTDALETARARGGQQLRVAERELRKSFLPIARAPLQHLGGSGVVSTLVLLLGAVVTGAVYELSGSASQALTTAVSTLTLWLLSATREAQRREARALRDSLDALRESLRVTHALLEASELQDVEELRSSMLPRASTLPRPMTREGAGEDETARMSTTAAAAI